MSRRRRHFDVVELYARPSESDNDGNDTLADLINSKQAINVVEVNKSGQDEKRWRHISAHAVSRVRDEKRGYHLLNILGGWHKSLLSALLPVGYPGSVSDDYLAYQTYDSLQAFFSTITSLLANRALLKGLGVGDADSSATYALLLTIFKDAVSRIATIVFAHRFGLVIEPEAKRYRFLADLLNDTAFFIELYSPYFVSWTKVLALCTAEALRAICGVAAGASKAALSLHFAKQDNLSELNAKEASQETAVGLVGLLVGTLVVRVVQNHDTVVYLMIALVLAHLLINYYGVRCVNMVTLNKQRATIIFNSYKTSKTVLTPVQVAERESILFWDDVICNGNKQPVCQIDFAQSYADAMSAANMGQPAMAVDGPMHTRFVSPLVPGNIAKIKILLWEGAEAKHAILAWFEAIDTAWSMEKDVPYGDAKEPGKDSLKTIRTAGTSAADHELWDKLQKLGWNLETGALETGVGTRLRSAKVERTLGDVE
ncbi:hypothetical protein CDD82_5067 [Ophiocordyceps australis]|uniref:Protein root UVB sensitive/RUS domain-containing protein n=1 Tax=Ophiocordyceps australis TaxID=1399860 RepID=A0A2C5ZS91_9HYPO|nr:hypothetical protein CDD82_5067 [Ophiocordyceps australis]